MTVTDRWMRSLFVSLAVGLGWGIRGDYGHLLGAMYPGACLGMAFAFVSGQKNAWKWMPLLGLVAGLGIGTGGRMSYGILHGYAKSDTLINFGYGFLTLILEGGAWGCFGCALVGMLLEKKRPIVSEWALGTVSFLVLGRLVHWGAMQVPSLGVDESFLDSQAFLLGGILGLLLIWVYAKKTGGPDGGDWTQGALVVFLVGWLVYFLVVVVIGFRINPDRSDAAIGYTGGVIGLFAWLVYTKKAVGLRGAFYGYIGFGMGMALGRLFANASYHLDFGINHWNIMEVSCGLIGGLVFTWGMLGVRFPEFPRERCYGWLSLAGMVYVMGWIPLGHRLTRADPAEKMGDWIQRLIQFGYANAEQLAHWTLWALNGLCVIGFLGAFLWYWLDRNEKTRWGAFPTLFFSLVMLLFQNTQAGYFFTPRQENQVNMHTVFWFLFAGMVMVAWVWPMRATPEESVEAERVAPRGWQGWVVGSVAVYLLILLGAHFANGEETMKSANTRFPVWAWTSGPPPGR